MSPTIKKTSYDQVSVEYLVQGSGTPILFLPSLGRGQADFDELALLMEQKGFKVIRPHPRGIGASQGPMTGITLENLAADVAAVIKAENHSSCIIAGHALGNFIARMTATLFPDLVRGVALLAGSPGKTPSGDPSIPPDILVSVSQSGNLALSEAERVSHLNKAFFAPGNDCHSWLQGWYPETKRMQWDAWHATPIDSFFKAGKAPVLDLQAALDTVVPRKYTNYLRNELGERVTVTVISNAGHALIPEQPEAVCEALTNWARSLQTDTKR
ncbi:alpha/beta fold hydrolase [Advenella sp. RU8]|uniref:alpha/beta fold hydrolase n=1 Tax=Advenella sp. RU8 TaxID=3399575 RepID=UPI003AABC5E3